MAQDPPVRFHVDGISTGSGAGWVGPGPDEVCSGATSDQDFFQQAGQAAGPEKRIHIARAFRGTNRKVVFCFPAP